MTNREFALIVYRSLVNIASAIKKKFIAREPVVIGEIADGVMVLHANEGRYTLAMMEVRGDKTLLYGERCEEGSRNAKPYVIQKHNRAHSVPP